MTAHERPHRQHDRAGGLRAALADLGEQARVYDALPGAVRRARRHRIRVRVAAAAAALAVLAAGITAVAWGKGALLSLPQPATSVTPTPTGPRQPGPVVPLPSTRAAAPLKPGMKVGSGALVTDRYLWTTHHRLYALPYSGVSATATPGTDDSDLSGAALSPDGHQLVYELTGHATGSLAGANRLVVQDLTTGRVHSAAVAVRGVAAWSANSRWALLFTPGGTQEQPRAHREAVRLDLRTGATVTFDLATVGASNDDPVPVVGAVRDDGRLVLAQAGAAPAFPAGTGSTAAGPVVLHTVDPSTGATLATTTLPGALPWQLVQVGNPGYTGPDPRPEPSGRLLVWLTDDERDVVVQVGPREPTTGSTYPDHGWLASSTRLYALDSGQRLGDVPGLAAPDSQTQVTVAAGGHDLTVVFAVGGQQLTVYGLDPRTGRKHATARYVSPFVLVMVPGQAAGADQQ